MSGETPSLDSYKLYTIAWVAALDIERAAAEAMLDEEHEEPRDFQQNPSDDNDYTWGRIGIHNIVIASLPSGIYGSTSATVTVRNLVFALPHIKFGVLVGIAGAIPQIITVKDENGTDVECVDDHLDIRLGDVVVGRPDGTSGGVVQYDLGKSKAGQGWERKGSLNAPPTALLAAISKLDAAHIRGKIKIPGFLTQMLETAPRMATENLPKTPSYLHQGFENDILFKAECAHVARQADCRLCDSSQQVLHSAANRAMLSQLPAATEARYDSFAEGKSPLCLKDTRVEILSEIFSWIDAADDSRVFWLNGMAGTGKSTISRTLAKTLDDGSQLGASFFFNRDEVDRSTIRKLSSTIAADLALRYSTACAQILQLISTDSSLITKSAQEQFKCLVLKPLSSIRHTRSVVIVIDALDECDEAELPILFRLISDFIKDTTLPRVKLFLTSRPDLPVLTGFGSTKYDYDGIILHDIERPIVEHDILVFLRHELHLIRDNYNNQVDSISIPLNKSWPDEQDVQKLLKMANKLFIFAATRKAAIDQITLILGALTVAEDPLSLHTLARLTYNWLKIQYMWP
ncbi:hypothetical protein MY5147_004983 [Beauveria neobassiana]